MTLKTVHYDTPALRGVHYVSGTVDTKEELEVFAHAVGAIILPKDEDDGPRAYLSNSVDHGGKDVERYTVIITLGTYVQWSVNAPPPDMDGEQTTG